MKSKVYIINTNKAHKQALQVSVQAYGLSATLLYSTAKRENIHLAAFILLYINFKTLNVILLSKLLNIRTTILQTFHEIVSNVAA